MSSESRHMAGNEGAFRMPENVRNYIRATENGLLAVEEMALGSVDRANRNSVLDVGVGAGRTTRFLAAMFDEYIGIDYSPPLVAAARARCPGVRICVADAREIDMPAQFGCVVFSYNGIDYVSKKDRRSVLANMARCLRSGGNLVYSTHNLAYERVPHWLHSFWVRELVKPVRGIRFVGRRLVNFWKQHRGHGVAYVNDPAVGFSLLTAYVDIAAEVLELRALGLEVIAQFGCNKHSASYDSSDSWVYIVARKITAGFGLPRAAPAPGPGALGTAESA